MTNEYYNLLNYFKKGQKISRSFLLKKPSITEELIDSALDNRLIEELYRDEPDDMFADIYYVITQKGIEKRKE